MNVTPCTIAKLGEIPIKQVDTKTIYLRDVARVSDGFALQTNVVRQDGHRGVLLAILKAGNASTLDVVSGIRSTLPRAAATLPPELKITPIADQSMFVRSAITGVLREVVIAAALTGLMKGGVVYKNEYAKR
jgi:multidrug efflux pump subunit AcrB